MLALRSNMNSSFMSHVPQILELLRAELADLDAAIDVLSDLLEHQRGRPPARSGVVIMPLAENGHKAGARKPLSAAERSRRSRRMKALWKSRKAEGWTSL